jgi:2-dehydropantoate 2-reductase
VREPDNDTWHVLGAGAQGLLWAALLHRAGRPVVLLLRDDARLAEYRRNGGITLHDGQGAERIDPPAVTVGARPGAARRVLVATKAHQTLAALGPFAPRDSSETALALLQNGMGVGDEIQARWPRARIYSLVTTSGSWRDGLFDVHRGGVGHTYIGRHGAEPGGDDVAQVARSLEAPGLTIDVSADIRSTQWRKLAVNCVVNPLAAIYELRNGDVPVDPRSRPRIALLCAEIARVAAAEGIAMTAQALRESVEATCRLTADNYNSMLQDLRAGRQTEIDYLTGYLLARAVVHDIDCPANDGLYAEVRRLEGEVSFP